ncbi:MAG: MarR family transcriptional regulator [Pseudonocardiaceae bacterium]|nr:MAG: MarR family transcriptional regulator [Pseudonocardiaceae bacterium]
MVGQAHGARREAAGGDLGAEAEGGEGIDAVGGQRERLGPITPGELAAESGLAPASVTGLLDRLTRKGVARRTPHPSDGRRFLVEIEPDLLARNTVLFTRFVTGLRELCAHYDTAELAVVDRFMTEAAALQQEATAELAGDAATTGGADDRRNGR